MYASFLGYKRTPSSSGIRLRIRIRGGFCCSKLPPSLNILSNVSPSHTIALDCVTKWETSPGIYIQRTFFILCNVTWDSTATHRSLGSWDIKSCFMGFSYCSFLLQNWYGGEKVVIVFSPNTILLFTFIGCGWGVGFRQSLPRRGGFCCSKLPPSHRQNSVSKQQRTAG